MTATVTTRPLSDSGRVVMVAVIAGSSTVRCLLGHHEHCSESTATSTQNAASHCQPQVTPVEKS